MSEQRTAFDKWFDDYEHNNDIRLAINYGAYEIAGDAWQAATAEANKRMAELEGEVAELKANSERLRKAAEKLVAVMVDALPRFDIIEQGRALDQLMKVMYDTPAESLQAHDAETIKRYADDLDNNHWVFIPHDLRKPLKEGK